jgi:hypothetical protein
MPAQADYGNIDHALPVKLQMLRELLADPSVREYLPASPAPAPVQHRRMVMPAACDGQNTTYAVQGNDCYVDNSTRVQVVVKREWTKNLFWLAMWAVGIILFFAWVQTEVIPTQLRRKEPPAEPVYQAPVIPPQPRYPAHSPYRW